MKLRTLAIVTAVVAAVVPGAAVAAGGSATLTVSGSTSSTKATAVFSPAVSGQSTRLQVLTIPTKETDETPVAQWETVATGKQSSAGKSSFTLTNPLEVSHQYRAVSGSTVSEVVTYSAPLASKGTGLPTVHFNSYEGDSVNTRTRDFEGEFTMLAGSRLPKCTAVAPMEESTMKGRGNYSWSFDKKSFTLKLGKSTDLCGMGKSKKYALVANHYDKSLLRNAVAYAIGKKLTNLAWTPDQVPVDVYVNGSYRGSYILVERIAVEAGRVAIDELKAGDGDEVDGVVYADGQEKNPAHPNNRSPRITGGYLLEWDYRQDADKNIGAGQRGFIGIKSPENEGKDAGISQQQVNYVNGYVDAADAALFGSSFRDSGSDGDGKGWREYIDAASAVDYYIGMELMKPVDGNMWASVYMYKPRGGKLRFGPLWDFDLAAGSANRAGNVVSPQGWYLRNPLAISARQSTKTWFNRLNEDPGFRSAVSSRWNQLYPTLSSSSYIDQQAALIKASASANFGKWSVTEHLSTSQVVKGSWAKEVAYLKSWMSSRRSWMNGQY